MSSDRRSTHAARRHRRAANTQRRVVTTGTVIVVAVALIAFLAVQTPNGLPLRDYRSLTVVLPDAGNLQIHNEVRARGVRVGQILDTDARNGRAVLKLQINPGSRPLPADTTPVVRGQGLLGQRYLELRPGTSTADLRDGATITGGASSLTYGIPDALNTFDPATRTALTSLISGLGEGLQGRGTDLNRALSVSPPAGRELLRVIDALFARPGAVPRLIPSLNAGMSALDGAKTDIAEGLRPTADALAPIVARATALQATLVQAPPTLHAAQRGLDDGQRLLAAVNTLADGAAHTLPAAPAGLRATTRLLRDSHDPLARATGLLRDARPTVPALLKVTDALKPNLKPVTRLLDGLQPPIDVLSPRICDLDNFAENWRSTLGYGVPSGGDGVQLPSGKAGPLQAFRITVMAGVDTLGGGLATPRPASQTHVDAYQRPCQYSPGSVYPQFLPPTTRSGR